MAAKGSSNNPSPFAFKSRDAAAVPGQNAADVPGRNATGAPGQEIAGSARSAQGVADARGGKGDPFGFREQAKKQQDSLFAPPSKESQDPGAALGYTKSLFGHKDEVSVYTAQMDARNAVDSRVKIIMLLAVAAIVLVPLCTILPKGLIGAGAPPLTPAYLFESFAGNVEGLVNWVAGGPVTTGVSIIFWQTAAIAFVGAALALNGCVYQGALNNALASPSTLGVMSGATLGTLVYTMAFAVPESADVFTITQSSEVSAKLSSLDLPGYLLATQGRALFSVAGCFTVVALILVIAHIAGRGKVSKVALLIAGQVFTALITGVIAVMRTYIMRYGTLQEQEALSSMVGGSVTSITGPLSFCVLVVPLAIGMVVIMAMRQRLNILAFDEDEAKSMGTNTTAVRNATVIICTLLTGIVVSFVGSVGFVGFLVPHLARKLVGPNFRFLIPASALLGAVYLLLADYLMKATTLFSGSLGTLTSLLGVVFFLVIAIRERARGNVSWV